MKTETPEFTIEVGQERVCLVPKCGVLVIENPKTGTVRFRYPFELAEGCKVNPERLVEVLFSHDGELDTVRPKEGESFGEVVARYAKEAFGDPKEAFDYLCDGNPIFAVYGEIGHLKEKDGEKIVKYGILYDAWAVVE